MQYAHFTCQITINNALYAQYNHVCAFMQRNKMVM